MERLAKRKYRNDKRKRWVEVTLEHDESGFWVCSREWDDNAEDGRVYEEAEGTTSERRFDEKTTAWDFIAEIENLEGWRLVGSQGEHRGIQVMPVHAWPTKQEAEEIAKRLDNGFWFGEQSDGPNVRLVVDDKQDGGLSAVTRAHQRSMVFAFARQACLTVLKKSKFDQPQARAKLREPKALMDMLRKIGLSPGKLFLELWKNADAMRAEAKAQKEDRDGRQEV